MSAPAFERADDRRGARRLRRDATGPVWNLTMAFPIGEGRADDVRAHLAGIEGPGPFAALPSVHSARLVVLARRPARRAPPPATVPLAPARLVFGVSVDAGVAVLAAELAAAASPLLGTAFAACPGFPGWSDAAALTRWLDEHRLAAEISFATVAAPVADIGRALARRDALARLLARRPSLDAAGLRRAFAADVVSAR